MRPLRLDMTGFGAFRERTVVDFSDIDLVALTGDTGAGKSTIIDAITFALYGSVVRYGDDRKVGAAINQTSTEMRLQLDFELAGREYRAVRVVRRTRDGATHKEARLERGDEVVAADAKSMNKAVEELLGLEADQFNRTVVLPQGRFADFLHAKPAERQGTLRQLLGLGMYERIGGRARAQATDLRGQARGLQMAADEQAAVLTDDRLGELRTRAASVDAAMAAFEVLREQLADVTSRRGGLEAERTSVAADVKLLADVTVHADADEVDRALMEAQRVHEQARAALDLAREVRRAARVAADAGPAEAMVRVHLRNRAELVDLDGKCTRAETELADARTAEHNAAEQAGVARERHQALEAKLAEARSVEEAARAAVAEHPSIPEIDAWLQTHARLETSAADVAAAERRVSEAAAALAPIQQHVESVRPAVVAATARLDRARELAGVAAYGSLLTVGAPCPLCQQEVHALVEHDAGDEVAVASAENDRADAALKSAETDLHDAELALHKAEADHESERKAHHRAAVEAEGLRPMEELRELRPMVESLVDEVRTAQAARQDAERAVKANGESADHQTTLNAAGAARELLAAREAEHRSLVQQAAAKSADLVGVPEREVLEEQLAEALRLAEERRDAMEAAERAETDESAAADGVRRAHEHAESSRRALRSACSAVAALVPPAVEEMPLAQAWSSFGTWVHQRLGEARSRAGALEAELQQVDSEAERVRGDIRSAVGPVLADALVEIDVVSIDRSLTVLQAQVASDLDAYAKDRAALEERVAQIRTIEDRAAVAEHLGRLLKANGFEAWLTEEAVASLVARATVRLLELSGGQYSLVVDSSGSFQVRDHTNADELRSVRTLSGGETFLASLALALALAEATAELAPEGSPDLESIFLDEGFGTLDSQTLDLVASAIEELGASGRLVGVVTHIRELAERMPVRLEVTKTAGSSRVQRVEV